MAKAPAGLRTCDVEKEIAYWRSLCDAGHAVVKRVGSREKPEIMVVSDGVGSVLIGKRYAASFEHYAIGGPHGNGGLS